MRKLPLLQNAQRCSKQDLTANDSLDVLFGYGLELLPNTYTNSLQASGFNLIDCSHIYKPLETTFSPLRHIHPNHFEFFLRWLVIEEYYKGESVCCYDGDIIFNIPVKDIASAFAGLTGTITSTCFAYINDYSWFDCWKTALHKYMSNPTDFITACYGGDRIQWATNKMQASPEEFFSRMLIDSRQIIQQFWSESFPYQIIPMPHELPKLSSTVPYPAELKHMLTQPLKYERLRGKDYIADKPVLLWHLQNRFFIMLSMYAFLKHTATAEKLVGIDTLYFANKVTSTHNSMLGHTLLWLERNNATLFPDPASNPFHVQMLYRVFFEEGDFGGLFKDKVWKHLDRVWH